MSKGSDDIVVVVVVVAMTTVSGSSQHAPLDVGQACGPVDDTVATARKAAVGHRQVVGEGAARSTDTTRSAECTSI